MNGWRRFAQACALSMALLLGLTPRPALAQAIEGTPDDLPDVAFDEGGCNRGEPGGPAWALNLATLQLSVEALDFRSRGIGPEVRLRRAYSAAQSRAGLLGSAWRMDYEAHVTRSQTGAVLDLVGGYSVSFTGALWVDGAWRTTDLALVTAGTSDHRLAYLATGLAEPVFVLDEPRTRALWRFAHVAGTDTFRLASIADRHGNAITLEYSGAGEQALLQRIVDARGRVTSLFHDGAGRLMTLYTPDSRVASFSYDTQGRLTESVDFLGARTAYTYDSASPRITTITAGGRVTTFEWTLVEPRRVSAVLDPALARTTYALDTSTGRTTITSPLGFRREVDHQGGRRARETDGWWREVRTEYTAGRPSRVTTVEGGNESRVEFRHDADGNLIERVDPQGRVTAYTWNAQRVLTSLTDAAGGTWRYDYNDRLSLKEVTSPLSVRTRFDYDERGLLLRVYDGLGRVRTLTWGPQGDLETVTDRAGRVLSFTHDIYGRPLTMRARSGGEAIALGFDALDRLVSTRWDGGERRVAYDACDIASVTDENGHVTTFAWDAMRRPLSVTDPTGGRVQFERDLDGLLASIRTPMGHVSRATLDRTSRTIQVTGLDAPGVTWRVDYAGLGRVLRLTDPRGAQTTETRNAAGETTALQDAVSTTEQYARDALGRVATITTAGNRSATFAYDLDRRLTQVTHDAAIVHRSTYDVALGLPIDREDAGRVVAFTHDPEGRVATATWRTGGLQAAFTWDAGGRLGAVAYPGGVTAAYAYDARERVRSVSINGVESTFAYDAADRLVAIARPQGLTSAFQWDAAGRLVGVEHRSAAGAFVDLSISRDAAGNVVAVTGLEPMPRSAQVDLPFTSYDLAGQVTTRGTQAYSYTAGDLTAISGGAWTATYDPQHRVASLTRAGQSASFAWDADGRRIARTAGGTRRDFHHGPDGTLLFESENGVVRRSYVYVEGRLFAMVEAGAIRYFHFDHLGSTLAVTEPSGAIAGAWGYDAAGRATARAGSPPVLFTFGGEFGVQDEGGGLFVMGARVYDAATMRFVQRHHGGLVTGPAGHGLAGGNPAAPVASSGLAGLVPAGAPAGCGGPAAHPLVYEYAGGNPTTLVAPPGRGALMPTATMTGGGGQAAIDRLLADYSAYRRFGSGSELANRARRTHATVGRMVAVHCYWTEPGQPITAPPYDFWQLWGALR